MGHQGSYQPPGGPYRGRPSNKKSDTQRRRRRNIEAETFDKLGQEVEILKEEVEKLKNPKGIEDNPARTCKDMEHCDTGFEDG